MTLAPISATGLEAQGTFTNIMLLLNDFWALMIAGNGWFVASRLLAYQIVAITWVNVVFRLGSVWFGRPPREPPDPCGQSWLRLLYDAVYVPLVEPIMDDLQDFCWRQISSVRRIVKWDLIVVLVHACRGTLREPGTDLFLQRTSPVDDVIVRHELNIHKQLCWWWTRSCTAFCSVACFSGNKNANTAVHFESSTTFIMDTGSTDHICKESNLFVGKIMPCPKINIKGIGGQLNAKGYGTIKFKIVDDHGKTHEMLVHNVLHVLDSPVNLLSPQKLARDDEYNGISGTCFLTCGNSSHFIWNNSK